MITMIRLNCDWCNSTFERRKASHEASVRRGRKFTFCSRDCTNKGYVLGKTNKVTSGYCKHCEKPFSRRYYSHDNSMFCSVSCSNRGRSSDTPARMCRDCQAVPVQGRRKLCDSCKRIKHGISTRSIEYESITLKELRSAYSTSQYHSKIRGASRSEYKRSGRSMSCENCGYDLHVDICHIRGVSDFPDSSTLSEVNDISNLIALDKRCHWEFDNGYLSIEQIRGI